MPTRPRPGSALRSERLRRLVWPIYLQNLSWTLVLMVDLYFFSQQSDATAGTVGQLGPIFGVGAFVINVFAGTGIAVASQFIGAGRDEKVVPTYVTNLVLASALGLGYAGLLLATADRVGVWMGVAPGQLAIAREYLWTIAWYFPFHGVVGAYNAILSSRGMTHWLMYTSFIVAGVNLILDPVFVWGLGWGVRGVCVASVAGVLAAMVTAMVMVHRGLGIRFELAKTVPRLREVLPLLARVGFSNCVEPFSYMCQQTFISTFVIALGVTAMAANNYAQRCQMFQITFAFSLASGGQILSAHWMGAGRTDDVDALFWRVLRIAMGVALVYALMLWSLAPWLLRVFTEDAQVLETGHRLLLISLLTEPARAVNIVAGVTLKAVGDVRFSMWLGLVFMWGLLPVVYLLDALSPLTLVGIWCCFCADEVIRAGFNLARWRSRRWTEMGFVEPVGQGGATA